MTAENFDRVFNEINSLQPFHVYTVELFNGRRFEVDHSRAMVIRDGVAVFMAPAGIPIWFDHDSVLRIEGAGIDVEV